MIKESTYYQSLPQEIKDVLAVFTEEEMAKLSSFTDHLGNFVGIGFTDEVTGKYTKFADPVKYDALLVLEKRLLQDLEQIQKERQGFFR